MTQEEFFKRYTYSPSRDRIGGGSFGTVYKAYDNLLHREVAIKVSEVKTSADGKKTFSLKDECEALSHVPKHPNIANYENKLQRYLEDYGKAYLYQKTGFLLSLFKKQIHLSSVFLRQCKANIGQSTRYLTDVRENTVYDTEWRLCVPVDLSDLTEKGGADV
jgi:serine/threonine protein kinase